MGEKFFLANINIEILKQLKHTHTPDVGSSNSFSLPSAQLDNKESASCASMLPELAVKLKLVIALFPNETARRMPVVVTRFDAQVQHVSLKLVLLCQFLTEPDPFKITTIFSFMVLRLSIGLRLKWDKGMRRKLVIKFVCCLLGS